MPLTEVLLDDMERQALAILLGSFDIEDEAEFDEYLNTSLRDLTGTDDQEAQQAMLMPVYAKIRRKLD